MSYKDRVFCASPKCINACGRKITDEEIGEAQRTNQLISWSFFCGTIAKGIYTNDMRKTEDDKK